MPTSESDWRPRLSVEITEEQSRALRDLIPWGLRRQLFQTIVDDIIRLARLHGHTFIAAVLSADIKFEDYTSLEVPKDANR